jgi:hypothetical protein
MSGAAAADSCSVGTISLPAGIQRIWQRFTDNRRKPRFATNEAVDVLDAESGELIAETFLTDISLGGVALKLNVPLMPGTSVLIRSRRMHEAAVVRHCRPDDRAYVVGCQFKHRRLWL